MREERREEGGRLRNGVACPWHTRRRAGQSGLVLPCGVEGGQPVWASPVFSRPPFVWSRLRRGPLRERPASRTLPSGTTDRKERHSAL